MRNLIVLIVFVFGVLAPTSAETIYVSGDVSGAWSADSVIVTDEIRIPDSQTLTIEPGVQVLFQTYCKFIVDTNATLIAAGTEPDSIRFDVYTPGDYWHGIRFLNANDSSRFEYCVLKHGMATGSEPDFCGGAIYCNSTNLTIEHSTLIDNWTNAVSSKGGAIYATSSLLYISDCIINRNRADGGMWGAFGGAVYIASSSPIIVNCDISDNYTSGEGGAIHCYFTSPTFINCTFNSNIGNAGGAFYCNRSSIHMFDCTLNNNSSNYNGGALELEYESAPTFTNCHFTGNSASSGGAVYCRYGIQATFTECAFRGNSASWGGGISSADNSSVPITLIDCTIMQNTASTSGGGVSFPNSRVMANGCLISGNTAGQKGGGIYLGNSNGAFYRCTITENSATDGGGVCFYSGTYNIDTLINCTISDNSATHGGGVYYYSSSAILKNCVVSFSNTGEGIYFANNQNPQINYCDIFGNAAGIFGGTVPGSLGQIATTNANGDSCDIYYNIFLDPLFVDPANNNFNLQENSPCIDAGDPGSQLDPDGTIPDIGAFYFFQSGGLIPVDGYCFLANQTNYAGSKVVFQAVSGGAITDSAFTNVAGKYEISISPGIYDIVFSHIGYEDFEISGQDITIPMTLPDVTLYESSMIHHISGSQNGLLEAGIYIVEGQISVESGDSLIIEPNAKFYFNGAFGFEIYGYVYAVGTPEELIEFMPNAGISSWYGLGFRYSQSDASRLEYCFITGSSGCGIFIQQTSPTIRYCTITGNSSSTGGGIYCMSYPTYPFISNCLITGNYANGNGGGIAITDDAAPTIEDCVIYDNEVYSGAGGIYIWSASAFISDCIISNNAAASTNSLGGGILSNYEYLIAENCIISGNSAARGGGIYADCNVSLTNSIIAQNSATSSYNGHGGGLAFNAGYSYIFSVDKCQILNNSAQRGGGGIAMYGNQLDMSDCVISNNTATNSCGGMLLKSSNATITNCTFSGNSASNTGGLGGVSSNPQVMNSIFWNNNPNQLGVGNFGITYSDIQGGWPGGGNINADPLFVDAANNELRLQWNSPCIDSGHPSPLYNDPDGTRADIGACYYDQSTPVRILVTPQQVPYLINASGSTIEFTIRATNREQIPHDVLIWCDITLADGSVYGPTLGPRTITIGGGSTFEATRTTFIPDFLAMGIMYFNAYAVVNADTIKDSFMFGKIGN